MLRRKAELFAPTDGVLAVSVADPCGRVVRGADFSDPATLMPDYWLAFRRMRVSQRDVELAGSTGCEITAKAEVRKAPRLTPESDAVLDGRVYEVTRVEDRGRTCWLWLAELATDGTCELVPPSTARDEHGIPVGDPLGGFPVWCRRVAWDARLRQGLGISELRPSLTLRVRAADYEGEHELLRGGRRYTVTHAQGAGRWVDLTCERKVADR